MSAPLTTFFFEATNFLLLAGGLAWLFFRPVRRALDDRRAAAADQARQAAERLAEAERLRAQAAGRTASLEQELGRMRNEVTAAARQDAEAIRSAARIAGERDLRAARDRLKGLADQEAERLAESVAAGCAQVIQHLMSELDAGDLDRALARLACRELRGRAAAAPGPVLVESARPLGPQEKGELAAAIDCEAAEFRTNPELIAGVRITTGGGLIDASGLGLAAYARRAMTRQLRARADGDSSAAPVVREGQA